MPVSRFTDPGSWLGSFVGHIDVACPACGAAAVVLPAAPEAKVTWSSDRRLLCAACGLVRSWPAPSARRTVTWRGDGRDPYFGEALWSVARCCGELLWGYNRAHLEELRGWVAADQRERRPDRAGASMVEKLPGWMTAAHNRTAVVAAIDGLLGRLPAR